MTRVLFTGNSHLAAVRMGWDTVAAQYPQIAVQFLGAPRETFDHFVRQDHRFGLFDETVLPKRLLEGLRALMPALIVDLRDFDRVVVVGSGWGELAVLGLLQRCGIDGLRPVAAGMQGLSAPAYDAFCADLARGSGAAAVMARVGPGPVTLLPRPIRSELLLETDEGSSYAGLAAHPKGMVAAIARYQDVFARVMGEHGLQVVAQPVQTLAETGLTRRALSVGAKVVVTRGTPREVIDRVHMTEEYGVLMVRRLLESWAA